MHFAVDMEERKKKTNCGDFLIMSKRRKRKRLLRNCNFTGVYKNTVIAVGVSRAQRSVIGHLQRFRGNRDVCIYAFICVHLHWLDVYIIIIITT